ncbi:PREDICTED: pentatricopeptide repeat-containing protein 1, mitochondrial isoform X2 [Trachymyrmex septentrionalis]|uniref:pentatricopeptide repeat-containing protein 1, mitochondrial isoform X2 n=1 Tax=Trachymyrmex septentrionalis TaxID=34720 RepID=UPI00084F6E92|nr:PREDICTED: pentatricopeptide repeat-containing protein 1, mitochondrial isoform X2 [Trachymyrmex septentrionalis]
MFCQKLRASIKLKNVIGYVNEFNHLIISKQSKNEQLQRKLQLLVSNFCTEKLPRSTDVFGDISGRKFERIPMDEREQEEEKFQDTEARVPRRLKPSLGQYAKMIKSHVSKNDLNSALQVLDLMKENRDKPTIYLYNLLLYGLAKQGDVKQCFSLYNKAKKNGLQPNAATYTSLFNACALSDNSQVALEHLNRLRKSLYERQFPLNDAHYNVMVKAYSWHGQIVKAFQLADEMRDRRIPIGEITYNSLFHGAISDKEAGLRHALIVWHLMHMKNIKPSLTTYNLLLRAIRDTNLGNLRPDDVLLSGFEQTRVSVLEGEKPDLLASPPILSTLLPIGKEQNIMQRNTDVAVQKSVNLNDVLIGNRLILFGGVEGFLNRMSNDGVIPNIKTITLLLDLIPNTVPAENILIKTAEEKNIELDIDFFNMLIKRRSIRFDYKAAKEVISIAEKKGLSPNVMTFGVLALGCQELMQAQEFLEGIEVFGYKPNSVIIDTLINTACHKKNFGYLLFMMKYMMENGMRPTTQTIEIVKKFSEEYSKIEKPKTTVRR